MTLHQYLETLRGQDVTVIGLGVSNVPLVRLLSGHGARVTARDQRGRDGLGAELSGELDALGVSLVLGDGYLEDLPGQLTFCTPGINPRRRELQEAVARGAVIDSEMNLFLHLCPCPVIGITGSDGKTTTTTIIAEMLGAIGKTVWLGGNIGTPLLDKADDMSPEDVVVVELSSFQLMTVTKSPNRCVITNISPNHLDVHTDMDEYIEAKCAIFASQRDNGLCILNGDDPLLREKAALCPGDVRFFSRKSRPEGGVWLEDGILYSEGRAVMKQSDIRIPGIHNVENYMAAIAVLEGMVPYEAMAEVARAFPGVEHRLELVRELGGVRYINDSIGSSPTRTQAGLKCFDGPLVLIAGGYDKKIPFDDLGVDIAARVRLLLLCGATAAAIEAAVRAAPGFDVSRTEIVRFESLDDLVPTARQLAREGDTVLFSPACASFDQFKNFGVRGRYFKELVNKLI